MSVRFFNSPGGRSLVILSAILFCLQFGASAYGQDAGKPGKKSFGYISGKVDIGGKPSKCKFPVPSSTVRAFRLYSPGFCAAAALPASGKYKLKVPPGPYAVLFDVWSAQGLPVKQEAIFTWVKPGEQYSIIGDGPKYISVEKTLLTNTQGVPFSPAEGSFYDCTPFLTAYLIINSKSMSKDFQIMEDQGSDSYDDILALIDANSAPEIPEAQRLDKDLALAHVEAGPSYKYEGTLQIASLPSQMEKETDKGISTAALQAAFSIFEQTGDSPVGEDQSSVKTGSAFDKAVSKRLLKLLKELRKELDDLPMPAKISLNFQGERTWDAWELIPDIGVGTETWECGPIVFKRTPSADKEASTSKIRVAAYAIDKANTFLSTTEWKMVGAHLNGELWENTNLDSPTVLQILIQKVPKDSTAQLYWLGGEVFEKSGPVTVYTQPQTGQKLQVDPVLSVKGQGSMTPYTPSTPVNLNTSYQGQEPISTKPTKWTYQLNSF